jgi:oligosaccharide translocation protein RFT1
MSMSLQSVVKHFLTEGDKFILSWFSPLQDQGGYAIAVNYGWFINCMKHRNKAKDIPQDPL